jgi:hypothetical protein
LAKNYIIFRHAENFPLKKFQEKISEIFSFLFFLKKLRGKKTMQGILKNGMPLDASIPLSKMFL